MRLTILVLFLSSSSIYAGSEIDAKDSLQNSDVLLNERFQKCVSYIDVDTIRFFKNKGVTLTEDIRLLCNHNDRNKAQNLAIGFSMEIQHSKDMLAFKQCGRVKTKSNSGLLKILKTYFISDLRFKHICD